MKKKKATIHDISKALRINSSTVSRALNNSPLISKKTKEIILKKSIELGYQKNSLASKLRMNKTKTIGVIVPRIARHFCSSVIAGIEQSAFDAGYDVVICQSLESVNREKKLIETLLANRVDADLFLRNASRLVSANRESVIYRTSSASVGFALCFKFL